MLRSLLAALLFASLALAGCSGGSDGDSDDEGDHGCTMEECASGTMPPMTTTTPPATSQPPTTGPTTSPAPTPREPMTFEITITGNDFVDGSIAVQAGDTVRWLHRDGAVPHSVTADDGTFDSGECPGTTCMQELPTRDTFEFTFDAVGEFPYHCRVHATMTDTITVVASLPMSLT
ncbi:MAG TPA: plastocyanin/azurin family copper-binding protein [Candidatus Thermoplasmatota archaeon]|nr:plastocyanin/azurin family copper-binding protein [Candidatus Thermoplasmatota archaeon]